MINSLFQKAWGARVQFIKYFLVGISGVILDISSLYCLKEYASLRPTVAVIINQALLVNYIFFLNKYWAFKSTGITHRQIIKFYLLAGANYAFSVAWMLIFNEVFAFNYLLVRLTNIILAVSWNFLLYKFWVFRKKKIAGF